ncbi:MAG: Ig-like domain-containing protein [Candidatus Eisenbacteria bacterium]
MHRIRALTLGVMLALAASAAGAGTARAVALSMASASGQAGQTVDVDVNTASMTGLGVLSAQFTVTYNANFLTATDVITTGTLAAAAGWAAPAFNVTAQASTGRITVSAAGTTALSGAGSLLKIRFVVNPAQLTGTSSSLTLGSVLLNEGTPTATTANGTFTILATPQIDVSPDQGEIVRGQTLQFSVFGSPTNPISWSTSDPLVATISATGLLTGVAPGAVTVTATDAAAHSATTTGTVLVRGMGLTAGSGSTPLGLSVNVPITVTSLAGLGIRSGQFTLTWSGSMITSVDVSTPPGTLLNGWGPVTIGTGNGPGAPTHCTVDFAGASDLTGSGVLCYVTFHGSPTVSGGSGLVVSNAVFNETLVAKTTNGSIFVTTLPAIQVNPDQVTLLAGQAQQMSVSGSPTNPIAWSVLDPAVATISPTGLLTAVHSGVTQVQAVDAIGSTDLNTFVRVYDFKATLGTVTGRPGTTVRVPLLADRGVGALGIVSEQLKISWTGTAIAAARPVLSAQWWRWGPAPWAYTTTANSIFVAAAGTEPFDDSGPDLAAFEFDIAPGATSGTNVTLTLSPLLFNEGDPAAQVVNGTIQVRNLADAESGVTLAFGLGEVAPNPVRGACRIPFTLPADTGGRVELALYGVDGRLVRRLADGAFAPGRHDAAWDGRDGSGRAADAGIYFVRLTSGSRTQVRKLAVVRSGDR